MINTFVKTKQKQQENTTSIRCHFLPDFNVFFFLVVVIKTIIQKRRKKTDKIISNTRSTKQKFGCQS